MPDRLRCGHSKIQLALAFLTAIVLAVAVEILWRMPEVEAWKWYFSAGSPAMNPRAVTLAAGTHWFDDYYLVSDLGNGAYAIGEPHYGQCNFNYLIVGTHQALLFDTGPGVRDIRPVVRSLTGLPVLALPSHLHFDHTGDLGKFTQIALPDLGPLRRQLRDGTFTPGFYQFLGFVEGFARPTWQITRWIAADDWIDLGGRRLQLLSVPGHTPDSVVLVDTLANRVFAGDFVYPSDIYAFLPGADLDDYARSAARVARVLNDSSTVYGAHGCDQLPAVDVPRLRRSDLIALQAALESAASRWRVGTGWYPRAVPVNDRMKLLAKYPWMQP